MGQPKHEGYFPFYHCSFFYRSHTWQNQAYTFWNFVFFDFCFPLKLPEFHSPVTVSDAVLPVSSQTSPVPRTQACRYRNLGHKWGNLESHYSVKFYTKYCYLLYPMLYTCCIPVLYTCHTHKASTQPGRRFSRCSLNKSVSRDWFLQILFLQES